MRCGKRWLSSFFSVYLRDAVGFINVILSVKCQVLLAQGWLYSSFSNASWIISHRRLIILDIDVLNHFCRPDTQGELIATQNKFCVRKWINSVSTWKKCGPLRDLVPFVQCKKREKHPWRSADFKPATLLKLTLLHVCFYVF